MPIEGGSMKRELGKCEKCGEKANLFRCPTHYVCDDCGTTEELCTHTEGLLCRTCHTKRVDIRIAEFDGDTDYTTEITCPHCGYEYRDSWESSDGDHECPDCERGFEVIKDITVTYCTEKI